MEPDENPLDCARRELEEEVGYRTTKIKKLTEIYSAPAYCTEVIYIFLATGLRPARQKLEDDEIIKVVKLPFKEAIELLNSNNYDIKPMKDENSKEYFLLKKKG